jgi:hypothetical protein
MLPVVRLDPRLTLGDMVTSCAPCNVPRVIGVDLGGGRFAQLPRGVSTLFGR